MFWDYENAGGDPVELYRFALDATVIRQTSAEASMTIGTELFSPAAIQRENLSQSGNPDKQGLSLRVPRDHPVANAFRTGKPVFGVGVALLRVHRNDPDLQTVQLFAGLVRAVSWSGQIATLICEPVAAALSRPALAARYQGPCNHVLFDSACGVLADSYRVKATVDTISGVVLTASAASAKPDNWLAGGWAETLDGERRLIIAHAGGQLTLLTPLRDLQPGDAVLLFPGCNLSMTDCKEKFNNFPRFMGFPFIPDKNPFVGDGIAGTGGGGSVETRLLTTVRQTAGMV